MLKSFHLAFYWQIDEHIHHSLCIYTYISVCICFSWINLETWPQKTVRFGGGAVFQDLTLIRNSAALSVIACAVKLSRCSFCRSSLQTQGAKITALHYSLSIKLFTPAADATRAWMPNIEVPIKCSSCWPDEWCLGTPNAHIRRFLVLIIRVLFSWTRESEDGRLCEDHKFPPVTRCSAFCLSEGLRKNCWTDSSERWQMGEGRIHQILREQWGKRVSRTSFIQDFKKINQGSALWDASTVDRCCNNLIEGKYRVCG